MNISESYDRHRTYYHAYPDYSRPVLKIPSHRKVRMQERLHYLYGGKGVLWIAERERILAAHHAHKPPEMIEKEKYYDPLERFSNEHIILITYGQGGNTDGGYRRLAVGRGGRIWLDLFTDRKHHLDSGTLTLGIGPYAVIWLKPLSPG